MNPAPENEEFREILTEKLLAMRITSRKLETHYDLIWTVFANSILKNPEYQKTVTLKLQESVTNLITSKSDIQAFNHVTKVISQFVQLKQNKTETLSEILLRESNFEKLDSNCLPLKMFKDLFL